MEGVGGETGVRRGPHSGRTAEHQRVPHSRSLAHPLSLSHHVYLARSNKIPTMMYTKTCQLHLLNLTTSHIPALSLADSSHHIGVYRQG